MSSHESLGEAFVTIRGDGSKFPSDIDSTVTSGVTEVVKKGAKILGGLVVAAKLKDQFKAGLGELEESMAVAAQTTAAIASTGGAAGVTAGHVAELADQMLNLSGVDDEIISKGANVLLSFTAVANQGEGTAAIFDRATQAGLDLATRGFGSVESNAKLLGRALSDPEQGLTKLARAGVFLTDQQVASIEAFTKVGELLGAQGALLDAIEGKVGGAAKAYGETLPGRLKTAQESFNNLRAEIVSSAAPAMEFFADSSKTAVDAISSLPDSVKDVIGGVGLLAVVAGGIVQPLAGVSNILSLLATRRAASSAAAAVETGSLSANTAALSANTAALAANAVANGALAVSAGGVVVAEAAIATNSAAAVASLYAVEGATVASGAAFGPWGIAVAAAIVAGSIALDVWGSKAEHTFNDVAFFARQTGEELYQSLFYLRTEGNTEDLGKVFDLLSQSGETGIGVLKRYREALVAKGESTVEVDAIIATAIKAEEQYQNATKDTADTFMDLMNAQVGLVALTDQLAQGFDKQYQAMLAPAQLHATYEAGVDGLVKSLRENKVTLDDTTGAFEDYTDAGRSNLDAMDSLGSSIVAMVEQRYRETHSLEDAKAAGALYVQNLREQLEAAGYNTEQIDLMIQTMHLTPEDIDTVFSNNAVSQQIAIEKYRTSLEELPPEKRTDIEAALRTGDIAEADRLLNEFIDKDRPPIVIRSVVNAGGVLGGLGDTDQGVGLAGGTNSWKGGWTWLGEKGAELVNLPRGSQVLPHNASVALTGGVGRLAFGTFSSDVGEQGASYRQYQIDTAKKASDAAAKSAAEAAKAAEEAARAAEGAAREFAQAVQAQHGREDVEFKVGALSTEEYRALLQQRMADTEQFSSDWFSAWQALTSMDQEAADATQKAWEDLADAQRQAADERLSIEDNMYEAGVTSTQQYLDTLQARLVGLTQYSDAYEAIENRIAGIEEQSQRAQQQAAEDQLDMLRNKVEFGVASSAELLKALRNAETGLDKYSDEWTTLQREIDKIVKAGGGEAPGVPLMTVLLAPPVLGPDAGYQHTPNNTPSAPNGAYVDKQFITTFPTLPADATLTPERVGTVLRRIEALAGG